MMGRKIMGETGIKPIVIEEICDLAKKYTYIERDVRVSVDCTDEKITGSCVKNIFGK